MNANNNNNNNNANNIMHIVWDFFFLIFFCCLEQREERQLSCVCVFANRRQLFLCVCVCVVPCLCVGYVGCFHATFCRLCVFACILLMTHKHMHTSFFFVVWLCVCCVTVKKKSEKHTAFVANILSTQKIGLCN